LIAEDLLAVRARVEAAARAAGRDPATVGLIAVSKTVPLDRVAEAWSAGHRDFGENYAQELRDKSAALDPGIRWHFIGRFQRNKAKYLVRAHRVHALESLAQAEALAERGAPPPVLVAVNLAGEASKGGVPPAGLGALLDALAAGPGGAVGLMCIPPAVEDPAAAAPFFAELRALAAHHRARGHTGLVELSMGMSHDFEVAIREGATWVRIGTAIFGARG
jgi:pyridoxal phosphate enzyme (YggS family)